MAVEFDPLTGKKKVSYVSGEVGTTTTQENKLGYGLTGSEKYKAGQKSTVLWDYATEAEKITGQTGLLSFIPNSPELKAMLESSAGQKLRDVNTEFANYYQAYMGEEERKRQIGKAFGVQNTVLSGSGAIESASASKKGTILGGGV